MNKLLNDSNISFLQQYAIFSQGNECPPTYHTWCGLSALSHAIGRRVWTNLGIFTLYPNIYVLLVGPPGLAKSTAADIARNLIRETKAGWILGAASTKEAWLKDFAAEKSPSIQKFFNPVTQKEDEFRQTSIFANEFLTLLQTGGDAMGYITVLTDIWDRSVFEVRTISRGTDLIHNPYITILGCMTPETTSNMIAERVLSTGFSRRVAFVWADKNAPPVPRPRLTQEQKDAWELAKKRITEIRQLAGEFVWSPESEKFYDAWYVRHAERRNHIYSPALAGFLQSKAGYVIKLAMLLTLSDSNELVLHVQALKDAIALMDEIEPNVDKIFAGTGKNELASISEQIYQAIFRASKQEPYCLSQKQIQKVYYKDAKSEDIDKILSYLTTTDRVVTVEIATAEFRRRAFTIPEQMATFNSYIAGLPSEPPANPD